MIDFLFSVSRETTHGAMDQHAMNIAVAFANFLQFNYQPHAETNMWYDHHNDQTGISPIPAEEIYKIFINKFQ